MSLFELEDFEEGMIIRTNDNKVLLVTGIDKKVKPDGFPIDVIHVDSFRNKQTNGYSVGAIREIIGTKYTHPEYLL